MITLSADRCDGLVEMLNIANGRAAASLSKTVNQPITIKVPTLELAPLTEAGTILAGHVGTAAGSVSQDFSGPFEARATLVFPREHCATLVELWSGHAMSAEEIADLEADTLAEIGNIVLYAAFGAIARMLAGKFTGTLPAVQFGDPATLLGGQATDAAETILLTFIDFGFARQNFRGILCLVLKPGALDRLLDCVDRFVAEGSDS